MPTNNQFAPIALFCYNRKENTRQVVEALAKNHLAKESELYVFSDAAKDKFAEKAVQEVRDYIKTITGFKNVIIRERESNYYIERNIIEGVTEVVNRHGKIIVLEDDGLVSEYFLDYMNDALDFYADKKRVMHIGAFTFITMPENYPKTILWRYPENTGGWATWADRWEKFHWFKSESEALSWLTPEQRNTMQLEGDFPCLGLLKHSIITWDISWYIVIAHNNGLTVNPPRPLMKNIGLYNGTHFTFLNRLTGKHPFDIELYHKYDFTMEENIAETTEAINRLKKLYSMIGKRPRDIILGIIFYPLVKLRITKLVKFILRHLRVI